MKCVTHFKVFEFQIESEAKGEHDIMSCQDVKRAIGGKLADFVAPLHADWLVVWGEEKDHDHIEVEFGDQVRLKTRGDSPLIGMKFSFCDYNNVFTREVF